MTDVRLIATLLTLFVLPVQAQDIDLSKQIQSGQWLMTYQRSGEIKPLHLKRQENGSSHTCIAGDARDKIVDWIAGKGCTIDKESQVNGTYHLEGSCRLKWWKSQPIPVSVDLKPESPTRFNLTIQTRDNNLMGYTEQTRAVRIGPCEAPSAGQPEQQRGTKT
ncbi:DUF3617 family protein [Parasulfuritortus cantonensis]|uniref:DUF3617 family protein n=1 Tax=Parasulfuritortus cantonensis TaxID=2528202 RepID=A0A4R1BPE2_9PROT|nr:DUF3617 family protein [Parasulfuritortus cantonensis]TCJ19533.1 DUF3617 family protein [Parasulfuritortus cantonensis]